MIILYHSLRLLQYYKRIYNSNVTELENKLLQASNTQKRMHTYKHTCNTLVIKVFSLVGDDTVVPVVTKDVTLLILTVLCTSNHKSHHIQHTHTHTHTN